MSFVKKEEGGHIKGEPGGKFDMSKIPMVPPKATSKALMKPKDEGKPVSTPASLKLRPADCKNRTSSHCLSTDRRLAMVVARVAIEVETTSPILSAIFA